MGGHPYAPELGLRRVSWVRVVVNDHESTAEVFGVGSRLPVVRRVTLGTALALAARGIPTVVHDRRDAAVAHEARA